MEDEYIPISYISQYGYCPRRAGLLLNECQWVDSMDTKKGSNEHKKVHTIGNEKRKEMHSFTELEVYSDSLQLLGKCDLVEVYENDNGYPIPLLNNKKVTICPVEFKHGRLRDEMEYNLQLCAQAMCLEDMYNCKISNGAIFYISSHRRKDIELTEKLREQVIVTAKNLIELKNSGITPSGNYTSKCDKCSLRDICLPKIEKNTANYMKQILKTFQETSYEKSIEKRKN